MTSALHSYCSDRIFSYNMQTTTSWSPIAYQMFMTLSFCAHERNNDSLRNAICPTWVAWPVNFCLRGEWEGGGEEREPENERCKETADHVYNYLEVELLPWLTCDPRDSIALCSSLLTTGAHHCYGNTHNGLHVCPPSTYCRKRYNLDRGSHDPNSKCVHLLH